MRIDKRNIPATIKRVIRLLFHFYPALLPFIIVCVMGNAMISSIPAVFQQNIIAVLQDAWQTGKSWSMIQGDIERFVLILLGLYILALILNITYNQCLAIFTQGSLDKLRKTVFNHMESLPISYFDTHQRGDIMSYYTNDIEAMRQMISQSFPQLLVSFVSVTTILCIMLYYSIPMALVILLGACLTITITRKYGGLSAKYFMAQQKETGKTEGVIEEMIHGQKVIKVFNHEQKAQEQFDQANQALFEASFRANRYSNTLMPILNNINYLIYAIVAIAGGIFIEYHVPNISISGLAFSIAVVVPFLNMSRQFAGAIQQISPQINAIVMGLAGAQRIFELLDETPEVDQGNVTLEKQDDRWVWINPKPSGVTDIVEVKGDVRFFDVDFAYQPDKMILHHINLFGKPGQKIAFVGATGAGKTTITNLINRFYDLADGKIRYDGININHISKASLRKSLGIVLQDTVLFTGTVRENIRYGKLDASDEEVIAAAKLAGAHDFIERLPQGYDTMLHGDGSNLSQGQCQLLAIARCAIANPPVMILDEATSSIDTRTEKIVQEGMDRLMQGRTVFVIAHRLSTVKNANAILVLDHGHIIERGTHEELLEQKGQYYQLYTGAFELE